VACGYWRCCSTCREIREMKAGSPSSSHRTVTCRRCKKDKEMICFPDVSDMCKACLFHQKFQYIICSSCGKASVESAMQCPDKDGKVHLCERCAGQEVLYKRTVCQNAQTAESFRANKGDLMRKFHRRCKMCERCQDCQRHYPDFRMFAVDSHRCLRCTKAIRLHVCQVCKIQKPESEYTPGILHHVINGSRKSVLRCVPCQTCICCNTYKDLRAFKGNNSTCIQCTKAESQYKCDACDTTKDAKLFEHGKLHRSHERQAYKVCLACIQLGYSSRDVKVYSCCGCGDKGHLRFCRDDLKNFKRRCGSTRLMCRDCSLRGMQITCSVCHVKKT